MLAFSDLYEEKNILEIWYSCSNLVTFAIVETKSNKRKKNNTQSRMCVCIYIYIYMGLVQVLLGETLNNVTPINIFNWIWILTNRLLDYIIFIYFPCLQIFKVIEDQYLCYLSIV